MRKMKIKTKYLHKNNRRKKLRAPKISRSDPRIGRVKWLKFFWLKYYFASMIHIHIHLHDGKIIFSSSKKYSPPRRWIFWVCLLNSFLGCTHKRKIIQNKNLVFTLTIHTRKRYPKLSSYKTIVLRITRVKMLGKERGMLKIIIINPLQSKILTKREKANKN